MTHEFEEFLSRPHTSWTGRTGKAPAPSAQPLTDDIELEPSGGYKAFGSAPGDDIESCSIAWWLTADVPQGQEVMYRYLMRVGFIGDDELHLMLTDCLIHIKGRNLGELRRKLARRKVTYVQAFNPNTWPAPPADQPLIDRITLLYPGDTGYARAEKSS